MWCMSLMFYALADAIYIRNLCRLGSNVSGPILAYISEVTNFVVGFFRILIIRSRCQFASYIMVGANWHHGCS